MEISQNEWYASFLCSLLSRLKSTRSSFPGKSLNLTSYTIRNLKKIKYHINDLSEVTGIIQGTWKKDINYDGFNEYTADEAKAFMTPLNVRFRATIKSVTSLRNSLYLKILTDFSEEKFFRIEEEATIMRILPI